jgi:hypothetical protein
MSEERRSMKRMIFATFPRYGPVGSARFTYRPALGWRMLQRACFAILRRIGAFVLETDKVSEISLDAARLSVGLIANYRREVERLMYTPARLVVGAEQWHELMGDPLLNQAVRFSAPVDLRAAGRPRLMGLDVTIVPWFDGVVILPLETETRKSGEQS